MNPFDTDEVKTLQREWYQRLKEDGFADIEDTNSPREMLKCWHSVKWKYVCRVKKEHVQNYYAKASALIHTHEFESEMHKKIWEYHCQGLSSRKIENLIDKSEKPWKRAYIQTIINLIATNIK